MQWWYNLTYVIIDRCFSLFDGVIESRNTFADVLIHLSRFARILNHYLPVKELYGLVPHFIMILSVSTIVSLVRKR